jgi:transposase
MQSTQLLTAHIYREPDSLSSALGRLKQCHTSAITELRQFAAALQKDYAAVLAALTLSWSSGPVEGNLTRLKLLKRQMYGRAHLDLLRIRVLGIT